MANSAAEALLYQATDFAIVRTPLLPVQAFETLNSADRQRALLNDPRVRKAVAVGSLSLFHALQKFEQGDLKRKDEEKLLAKLLRYQIRMATRPTPYGLFAGCAIAHFGDRTDLTVRTTPAHSCTRPDMAWLMNFVAEAESDPVIRRELRLIVNPLIELKGGRVSLTARMPGKKDFQSHSVSIRTTPPVIKTLELARTWIAYVDLFAALEHSFPSATPRKIEGLLEDLQEQTILLTDLRPPLTIDSPAHYVLNRLRDIPAAFTLTEKLEALLAAACRWDRTPQTEILQNFRALLKTVDCPEDGSKELPFQVDMAIEINGVVNSMVAMEAARAADLLLRLSPSPRGLSSLAAYRSAFVSRYGYEREVPLLELLDPTQGLGPVSTQGHAFTGPDQAVAATRNRTLTALACTALHERQTVLLLDEKTTAKLETCKPTAENVPVSLDINLLIAAKSAAAVDKGEFTAVIGPNLGGWQACRNFGRFAHLLPDNDGATFLRRSARLEETSHFQDHLWAEIVYLPSNVRSANVAVRPAARCHEVFLGVTPGVPEECVIPLEDLVVGVAENRFYVRSQKRGKRIRFVSGHMLNHRGAPAVVQFLAEVAFDGLITFNSFDWGPAEAFPFLPRVQIGRIVLRPAEWKLAKNEVASQRPEAFQEWRAAWNVPRHVCLAVGDNRLILDLECPAHVRQILSDLGKLPEGHSILLQEVVPALGDAWLEGPEGHYYSELIVPLVLRPVDRPGEGTNADGWRNPPGTLECATPGCLLVRSCPPGSDWLFAKLYCSAACEDELISERLLPLAENALAAGLADSWFFIRYADPERHIRLRFHGEEDRLADQLFGQIGHWGKEMLADGLCTRVVIDTYDRELERFGGPEGMLLAERIFHADSRFAAAVVRVLRSKEWEDADRRLALSALSLDDLFRITRYTELERLDWYKQETSERPYDAGTEYRRFKTLLRAALGNQTSWLSGMPFGDFIEAALIRRAADLSETSTRLLQLSREHRLTIPVAKLFASYAHLHLNRMGAANAERMLFNLLFRTRASLKNSPLKS